VASRSAAASPSDAPHASPTDIAAAQALFEEGRALMARERPEDACPKFEESQRLDPGLGTEFNLASCYEKLGKLASAYALFTEVEATARATGQGQREEVARARADAVKPKLTKLAIVVPAGSAGKLRVDRDGTEIGEAEWGFPVPVDPGPHHVQAFGNSVGVWSRDIDVPADGAVHQVEVPSADRESGSPNVWHRGWVLGAAAIGVVGLGTGSFFALRAISQKNAADAAGCQDRECPTQHGVDLRSNAHETGNLATLGMGIGLAGIAAAALLWWLPVFSSDAQKDDAQKDDARKDDARKDNATQLTLTPVALPGNGGLLLHARF
jgi:tetratricopeptide (TPR) repeat protein